MIRKLIGSLLSWTLYYIGDIISIPIYKWDYFVWLYPAYNNIMTWSYDIQIWGQDSGPWKNND